MNHLDKKYLLKYIIIHNYGDYFILEWLYFTSTPNHNMAEIDLIKNEFADAILKELGEKPKEKERLMEMI